MRCPGFERQTRQAAHQSLARETAPSGTRDQVPHSFRRFPIQHRLSVLHRPHQVQVYFVYRVRAALVFSHPSSLLGGAPS